MDDTMHELPGGSVRAGGAPILSPGSVYSRAAVMGEQYGCKRQTTGKPQTRYARL